MKKILINTGGGDAPGLNAVIRAITLSAHSRGWEVHGIRYGYEGLFREGGVVPLTPETVRGITHLGGSILGTNSRGNPLQLHATASDGLHTTFDASEEIVERVETGGYAGLIAIGGDGSLHLAAHLYEKGLRVIGVPKTIDNDLRATAVTFGFATAVQTATDALDKLHSTAEAHQRVMVVELMGRHTGWIALHSGIAGSADVILIPEIPYDLDRVCEKIESRYRSGREFALVAVAEGASPKCSDGVDREKAKPGSGVRYGGMAERLAEQIAARTGRETRSLVLGHLQRGGGPTAADRLLALRFGAAAVEQAADDRWGSMVAINPPQVEAVPLPEAVKDLKTVPIDDDSVRAARAFGVSLGD